jgi:hypothetical protein
MGCPCASAYTTGSIGYVGGEPAWGVSPNDWAGLLQDGTPAGALASIPWGLLLVIGAVVLLASSLADGRA